jgi:large subunit ribosomal protein L21
MLLLSVSLRRIADLQPILSLSKWQNQDRVEATKIHTEQQLPRVYQERQHEWQNALKKKAEYRVRREEREAQIVPATEQVPKLVLHNNMQEVPTPLDHQVFAVVALAGLQYKVTKDDVLKVEKLPYDVGTQFVVDRVMLVGTPWYTLLGRPMVTKAKVYLSVEEHMKSEKLLVFKKKRRKGYQKSMGHRQQLTVLRVDKIEHVVEGNEAVLLPEPDMPKS